MKRASHERSRGSNRSCALKGSEPMEGVAECGARLEVAMNRRMLVWVIATMLLTAVGCPPRHPPHTPQPLRMVGLKGATIVTIHQMKADDQEVEGRSVGRF